MSRMLCDLFYYSENDRYTDPMFNEMWEYNRDELITIMFYLRGYRLYRNGDTKIKGKGHRKIFYDFIRWMSFHKLSDLMILIPIIPPHGCWKDLLFLMGTPAENSVIQLFSDQLIKDHDNLNMGVPGPVSLASKWTPNEGSSFDRKYGANRKISKRMGVSRKELRTQYLVPLRRYLGVTEQIISDKRWSSIDYNFVPMLSMKVNSNTFKKHDGYRFNCYLNARDNNYLHQSILPDSPMILENDIRGKKDYVFAIDISGSMAGFPAILASCLCKDSNSQYWIPFMFDAQSSYDSYTEKYRCVVDRIMDEHSDIISYGITGCIEIAKTMNKSHIIFISDILVDASELPAEKDIYITFWSLTMDDSSITDHPSLTIIEGYDINVYNEIKQGHIINRDMYKNIITKKYANDLFL